MSVDSDSPNPLVTFDYDPHVDQQFTGSAVTLFGRKWFFSTEDVLIPSCFRFFIHLPTFITITAIYASKYSSLPKDCDEYFLHVFVVTCILLYCAFWILDLLSVIVAYRTPIAESPNQNNIILIYVRGAMFFIHFAITLFGSIVSFGNIAYCGQDGLQKVAQAISIFNWIIIGIFSCITCTCYNSDGHFDVVPLESRENTFSTCVLSCCWSYDSPALDSQPDIFRKIALQMHAMFSDMKSVVPSDLVLGLFMVRSLQGRQRKLGKRFLIAESRVDKNLESDDAVKSVMMGRQPTLDLDDWARIREAKYYSNYAIGTYGWMLYVLTQPCSFCELCFSCCIPTSTMPEVTGELVGDNCCHCTVNSFLIRSGLPNSQSILHANLLTDVGRVIFFVAVDHDKQSLVIAVRGSMSFQDATTDAYAIPSYLDEYGLNGHLSHAGMAHAAQQIYKELESRNLLSNFMELHPNYRLVICGHSLGAAVSCLLSAKLHLKYPSLKCYAYAPPLLFDESLALESRKYVTSIVYRDDLVPRCSTGSVRLLKNQIKFAFRNVNRSCSKWEIFMNKRIDAKELENYEKLENQGTLQEERDLFSHVTNQAILFAGKSPPGLPVSPVSVANDSTIDLASVALYVRDKIDVENPNTWPELHHPGIIYHMLPAAQEQDTNCPDLNKRLYSQTPDKMVIYRSHASVFQEIVISANMFDDHMPYHYTEGLMAISFPE